MVNEDVQKCMQYALNAILMVITVISFCFLFEKKLLMLGLLGIFILVVWGIIYVFLKRKKIKKIKCKNTEISIRSGDIFSEKGLKVIPIDKNITLEVDGITVSFSSLHGKFIEKFSPQKKELKRIGDLYLYKDEYVLFPFTEIIEKKSRVSSKKEYVDLIYKLLDNLDAFDNGKKIVLPVIGDGGTRIPFINGDKTYELLNLIIEVIRMYDFEKKVKIEILIFDRKIKYLSIN